MSQFPLDSSQKVPFVCFVCRTTIKRPIAPYWEEIGEKSWANQTKAPCPQCKKPMAYVGRYFKVPPKTAIKQWRKAELLWRSDWIADGYSEAPNTLRDARELAQKSSSNINRRAIRIRAENEERWRRLRAKREQLRRHKAD